MRSSSDFAAALMAWSYGASSGHEYAANKVYVRALTVSRTFSGMRHSEQSRDYPDIRPQRIGPHVLPELFEPPADVDEEAFLMGLIQDPNRRAPQLRRYSAIPSYTEGGLVSSFPLRSPHGTKMAMPFRARVSSTR